MGSFIRLPPRALDGRIDATYYRPEYVANAQRLASSAVASSALNRLVSDGRRTLYFGTTTLEGDAAPSDWVPFLTSDDLDDEGFFIETRASRRVASSFLDNYPAGRLRSGELLVKVKGPNQTTAYVETAPEYPVLVSGTIWGGLVRKGAVDPHYLVAALSCPYAAMARTRLRTNLNVEFLSAEDLLSLALPTPATLAQRYIGDKVRQAERLRERARQRRAQTTAAFRSAGLRGLSDFASRTHRVPAVDVLDRLDALHYRADLLDNLHAIRRHSTVRLGSTSDFAGLADGDHGNPSYGVGPIYVRATELAGDLLDAQTDIRLDGQYASSLPSSVWATSDEVLFSIVGTLGATGILEDGIRAVLSRGVAKVRPLSVSKQYIKAFMRTNAFAMELLRRSVGTIQRGVYLESLQHLEIPVLDGETTQAIANNEEIADRCLFFVKQLTRTAKLLVENLIEGRITEADLSTAQRALDGGDRNADWEILRALRQSDAPDAKPFIADVDALYALLDEPEGQDA